MCSWNPIKTNLIATGSGDATARIWTMGGDTAAHGFSASVTLKHGEYLGDKNKDVTTLEWSPDGTKVSDELTEERSDELTLKYNVDDAFRTRNEATS